MDGAISYLHTHHASTCSHTIMMGMSAGAATALMSFPRIQHDIDGMIVMASFTAVSDVLKYVTPMFFKKFRGSVMLCVQVEGGEGGRWWERDLSRRTGNQNVLIVVVVLWSSQHSRCMQDL